MPNYFMHAVVPWTDLFLVRTLMAAWLVASTVHSSASLASESLSKSQGWLLCPPTPWALMAFFYTGILWPAKNRRRFRPVRFSPEICQINAGNTGDP
jgi:hypothetical protein